MERDEIGVLLVLPRAVVPTRENDDHRVDPLELAQLAASLRMVRELVVRECAAGDDVASHAQDASIACLIRCANSPAPLRAPRSANGAISFPNPCPSSALWIVSSVPSPPCER